MTVTDTELVSPDAVPDTAADGIEPFASDEFDLDIRFAESGPVLEELMRPTDDGCGKTCESACTPSCP